MKNESLNLKLWSGCQFQKLVLVNFFNESCDSMNKTRYVEVLGKVSLPFMDTICEGRYICYFRPDLAPCHYAQEVLNWLESKGVSYVHKTKNHPNCLQIRPIENFWAILKQKVYEDNFMAYD